MKEDEFQKVVEEFCDSELGKKEGEFGILISEENRRCIRNMSNYSRKKENNQYLDEYIQEVLGISEVNEKNREEFFKKAILESINYENRNQIEFVYDGSIRVQDFIKNTLEDINDGKRGDVPYPQKITLKLNRKELPIDIPEYVNAIIDTKGLQNKYYREDMKEIFSMEAMKDRIYILCEGINDLGDLVKSDHWRSNFIRQNTDIKHKTVIMGLEKGDELSHTNEADGQREIGKELKTQITVDKWNNLCLGKENITYFNAFYGIDYKSSNGEILEIDKEKYEEERKNVFEFIEQKIKNMYQAYSYELNEIYKELDSFSKNELTQEQEEKIRTLKDFISEEKQKIQFEVEKIFEDISRDVSNVHASKLRGSVNRRGYYDNFNLYINFEQSLKNAIQECFSKYDYSIESKIEKLFDREGMEEAIRSVLLSDFKQNQIWKTSEIANYLETIFKDFVYPDEFWEYAHKIWGNPFIVANFPDKYGSLSFLNYREKINQMLGVSIKEKNVKSVIEQFDVVEKYYRDLLNEY